MVLEKFKTSKNPQIQQCVNAYSLLLPVYLNPPERNAIARDFTSQELRLRRLREESDTDSLTGLKNKKWFKNELGKQISHSNRYGSPLSLLFIDVDNFKQINTQYGHLVGDEILQKVGDVALLAREDEPVARVGGDEFTQLFVRSLTPEELESIRERYSEAMQALTLDVLSYKTLRRQDFGEDAIRSCSLSMGIAIYRQGEGLNDFYQRANGAMYQAKEQGKNQIVVAA